MGGRGAGRNTTQQTQTAAEEERRAPPPPFASVDIYNWNVPIIWHVRWNSQMHLHHYIQTWWWSLCDSAWSLPSIYVHLQHLLHTPFTSVPELRGASPQPFARGTKQPYSDTGSDDSDSWGLSVWRKWYYSPKNKEKQFFFKRIGFWKGLRSNFTRHIASFFFCFVHSSMQIFIIFEVSGTLIIKLNILPFAVNESFKTDQWRRNDVIRVSQIKNLKPKCTFFLS